MSEKLLYLTNSYQKTLTTKIVSVVTKGNETHIVLEATIFYPAGGGQPSDQGTITGKHGMLTVMQCRIKNGDVVHVGTLRGKLSSGETVTAEINWNLRFDHMRWHSAGHVIHEVVMQLIPGLMPIRGEHGKHAYIEYRGTINEKLAETIEKQANLLIAEDRAISTRFVTLEELKKEAAWIPEKLPTHKPLRILQIESYPPIPDGGTQVERTAEIGLVKITGIETEGELVRVHYALQETTPVYVEPLQKLTDTTQKSQLTIDAFRSLVLEAQREMIDMVSQTPKDELEKLKVAYFGTHGEATQLIHRLTELSSNERKAAGMLVNEFKQSIKLAFEQREQEKNNENEAWFDVTLPGQPPPVGHLHIVTQAIMEITRIFSRIGFTRVRHPEVDWDYYAFESLNMPKNHPARDEWETFFVESSMFKAQNSKFSKIVLTPQTSNGQVREMEKGKLPIRMINIAKCYRRQSDVSHVPMFHQFEGLYVDKNVSIGHLKGVFDYFVKQFYGENRETRLRPYHFQFTEPSFEVDISCGVCNGKGCKLCKEGWLELGGAGMVHPNVLKAGGIDIEKWNGFAFGWGIERTYMMKSGMQLDDIRLLYSNDVRFLEQF